MSRYQNIHSQILTADIVERLRDLIREICRTNDVEIIKGHISKDPAHLFLSVPPHISISQIVKLLKGKTSRKMLMEFKTLSKNLLGQTYMGKRETNFEIAFRHVSRTRGGVD